MTDWLQFWVTLFWLPDLGKHMTTLEQKAICCMILPAALGDIWRIEADNDNSNT